MNHRRFLLSVSVGLAVPLISGCNLQPKHQVPTADIPVSWSGQSSSNGQVSFQKFIRGGDLRRIIKTALENNKDLRISFENIDASKARYQLAKSQMFPSVDMNASAIRQRTASDVPQGSRNFRSADFDLTESSYELDFFGRIRSMRDAARQEFLSTEDAHLAMQLSLISEIAKVYALRGATSEQILISRNALSSATESSRLMGERKAAGQAAEMDVESANVFVRMAEDSLIRHQKLLEETDNLMRLLVGRNVLAASQSLTKYDFGDIPVGIPSEVLVRRPDVRQSEHLLRGANANIGAARAAFFPSIGLTGQAGVASKSLLDLFSRGTGIWMFSPTITVPIFDGGANRARLSLAEVRRNIEVANYEKIIQQAYREAADALSSVDSARKRISSAQSLVASQEKRLAISKSRFEDGADDYFEVLSIEQELLSAQQQLVLLRLSEVHGKIAIFKALGGGF